MALTDAKIRKLKFDPNGKNNHFDGGGLFLAVLSSGTKSWRYKFRLNGKSGKFNIGLYPDLSLLDAREIHQQARNYVAQGIHPRIIKEQAKAEEEKRAHRFSHFFDGWQKKQALAESTRSDLIQRVEKNLIPFLDKKNVDEWTTRGLLNVVNRMVERGALETAYRMARTLKAVYNEILLLGIVETNPAQGLTELLPSKKIKPKSNFAAITDPQALKAFVRQLNQQPPREDYAVFMALKLIPLVFLRPYNIRYLRWEYVDFEAHQIHIPASEMKTNKPHIVPLSRQAQGLLQSVAELTGGQEFVFLTSRGLGKPMSENTTTRAFQRRINPATGEPYGSGAITSHGFRHTASTLLNEMGFNADLIEVQLSHLNKDAIRATYNKADWLPDRHKMMQTWSDYIDSLLIDADVVPIHGKKTG